MDDPIYSCSDGVRFSSYRFNRIVSSLCWLFFLGFLPLVSVFERVQRLLVLYLVRDSVPFVDDDSRRF